MNEQSKRGGLLGGIILIAFGCMFLLDRFVVFDFGHLMGSYWPMILVVVGAFKLSETGNFWSGLWMVALGAWMQVSHLRMFGLSWKTSWPLLLIILGAGLILRSIVESAAPKEQSHER